MATTKYAPNQQLPASVSGPIQQSIANIQAGINSMKGGSSSSSGSSGSYNPANPGGNPLDAPGAVPVAQPGRNLDGSPIGSTPVPAAKAPATKAEGVAGPLGPDDQVPDELANQVAQAQVSVNQLAQSKGLKLQPNGTGGYTTTPDLASQYQQAHKLATQSGETASQSSGTGSAVAGSVMQGLGKQNESPSIWGNIFQEESNVETPFVDYDEYFSPKVQKESLVQQYEQMSSKLGLSKLNTDLINEKSIIDGTEDSIAAEIMAAGGMATERQVQAMGVAANKQRIANYNKLLDTRTAVTTQLSTMMQLSVQDRQFAQAEMDRKMNYAFKVAEFRDKAKATATTQMKYLIDNGFGGTLLTNPTETRLAEKVLGVPSGGLSMIVAQKNQDKQLELEKASLQNDVLRSNLSTDALQRQKLQSDISTANRAIPGTPEYENVQGAMSGNLINSATGKPDPRGQIANIINATGAKTDDKLKLTGAVISATQALAERSKNGKFSGINTWSSTNNFFRSPEGVANSLDLSALEGTVEAWMTGASVSEDQAKRIKKDMLPKQGDLNSTIRKKINALTNYMVNYAAGSLSTQGVNWTPQPVDFFAPVVATDPSGGEWIAQ